MSDRPPRATPGKGGRMSRPNHCDPCPFAACLACGYKGGTWGTEGRPE